MVSLSNHELPFDKLRANGPTSFSYFTHCGCYLLQPILSFLDSRLRGNDTLILRSPWLSSSTAIAIIGWVKSSETHPIRHIWKGGFFFTPPTFLLFMGRWELMLQATLIYNILAIRWWRNHKMQQEIVEKLSHLRTPSPSWPMKPYQWKVSQDKRRQFKIPTKPRDERCH